MKKVFVLGAGTMGAGIVLVAVIILICYWLGI